MVVIRYVYSLPPAYSPLLQEMTERYSCIPPSVDKIGKIRTQTRKSDDDWPAAFAIPYSPTLSRRDPD